MQGLILKFFINIKLNIFAITNIISKIANIRSNFIDIRPKTINKISIMINIIITIMNIKPQHFLIINTKLKIVIVKMKRINKRFLIFNFIFVRLFFYYLFK